MSDNIIKWIQTEAKEFTSRQSISELLSDSTKKYKYMEDDIVDSLLRAMSFMSNEITGEPLPLDDLFPAMTEGLLSSDSSYESSEFIHSLMEKYEQEVAKYKAADSNEVTNETQFGTQIDGMHVSELILAIARAHGISIYDKEWPCYYFATEMFAMTIDELNNFTKVEIDRDKDIAWPVTCKSGCGKGETPVLEPILDYSDITRALLLVSDLKPQGFRLSTRESLVDGAYTCSFTKDEIVYSGSSKRLPIAISKAYLKVFLFELNPDATRRVFNEKDTASNDDVEEVTPV